MAVPAVLVLVRSVDADTYAATGLPAMVLTGLPRTITVQPGPAGADLETVITITPTNGTAVPDTLTFAGELAQTFVFTPTAVGTASMAFTNDAGLVDPADLSTHVFDTIPPVSGSGGGWDGFLMDGTILGSAVWSLADAFLSGAGAGADVVTVAVTGDLLLESGDHFLLEDGSSVLLLG